MMVTPTSTLQEYIHKQTNILAISYLLDRLPVVEVVKDGEWLRGDTGLFTVFVRVDGQT